VPGAKYALEPHKLDAVVTAAKRAMAHQEDLDKRGNAIGNEAIQALFHHVAD
jgi:hypothetical protein